MSFVQNYPFFSIVLSLICAVVTFVVPARWGRRRWGARQLGRKVLGAGEASG